MTDIDTRPQVVNIEHYAGDTLTIDVKISAELLGGRVFSAQIRDTPQSQKIDATFSVIPQTWGASLVLSSADCQRLAKRDKFTGHWDVQIAMPGNADPVDTLGYGTFTVYTDVTRVTA